jgi:acyl-CoA thioesterase-1
MDLVKTKRKLSAGNLLTIAALGDSLTYGWMVEKGYLDFLKEMLLSKFSGCVLKIINRGIPGDTADGGLRRLQKHIISVNPDLTLVQFALNDAYSGYPLDEFENNITAIIEGTKNHTSSEIILTTSSSLEGVEQKFTYRYYDCLKNIAEKENVPIALVHEYWEKKISEGMPFSLLVQEDRVHPTVEGYRLMAEAIMQLFC